MDRIPHASARFRLRGEDLGSLVLALAPHPGSARASRLCRLEADFDRASRLARLIRRRGELGVEEGHLPVILVDDERRGHERERSVCVCQGPLIHALTNL